MMGAGSVSKLKLGILFGGQSTEHEVSLQSARSVLAAIDRNKYEVILIGIDKDGKWYLNNESEFLLTRNDPKRIALHTTEQEVVVIPGTVTPKLLCVADPSAAPRSLDVVFPILHGRYGEDGTIQGLLSLAGIPFVGPDVLGSAIGMDKDVTKRLWRDAGLPIARFVAVRQKELATVDYAAIIEELGWPLFVKPANSGSSVGVSKANNLAELKAAMTTAFSYDRKLLIEECIIGRELECSVLGNGQPLASRVGEIIAKDDFYSYTAKYIDETGAELAVPAKIPPSVEEQVQRLAVQAFCALECEGMARVDFFLTGDQRLLLNEINTIPGFTAISMYPKLWEISGLPYGQLIDRLIELALERHRRDQQLATSYQAD